MLTNEQRTEVIAVLEEEFGVTGEVTHQNISATISGEMRSDAIVSVLIATACMLLYIWFRFKDIRFATSAVLALVHDVLVVLTLFLTVSVRMLRKPAKRWI